MTMSECATRRRRRRHAYSQECVVPPHAAKFEVANHAIPRHAERVRDLALLLYGEQNITLHAEHKHGRVRKRAQALGEVG